MDTVEPGGYELHLSLTLVMDDAGNTYHLRTITNEHNSVIYQSRIRIDSFAEKNNFVRQFEEHILEPGDSTLRKPEEMHQQLTRSLDNIHSSLEELRKSFKGNN